MGRTKSNTSQESHSKRKQRPAANPEDRENQLIALAVDLAEKQLLEGTASSQVISHFLKMGSTKERLEKEMMEEQKKLLEAKTEAIQSQQQMEDLYRNALKAMQKYKGEDGEDDEDD